MNFFMGGGGGEAIAVGSCGGKVAYCFSNPKGEEWDENETRVLIA